MIKQHFIVVKTKEVVSRTYGGSTYTLTIYENTKKGESLKYVASCKACTRGHKGEVSEALTAIIESGKLRPAIMKRCKLTKDKAWGAYYCHNMNEHGLTIDCLC